MLTKSTPTTDLRNSSYYNSSTSTSSSTTSASSSGATSTSSSTTNSTASIPHVTLFGIPSFNVQGGQNTTSPVNLFNLDTISSLKTISDDYSVYDIGHLENILSQLDTHTQTLQQALQGPQHDLATISQLTQFSEKLSPVLHGIQVLAESNFADGVKDASTRFSNAVPNKGSFLEGFQTHPFTDQRQQWGLSDVNLDPTEWIKDFASVKAGTSLISAGSGLLEAGSAGLAGFGSALLNGGVTAGVETGLSMVGMSGLVPYVSSLGLEAGLMSAGASAGLVGGLAAGGILLAGVATVGAGLYGLYQAAGGKKLFQSFEPALQSVESFFKLKP